MFIYFCRSPHFSNSRQVEDVLRVARSRGCGAQLPLGDIRLCLDLLCLHVVVVDIIKFHGENPLEVFNMFNIQILSELCEVRSTWLSSLAHALQGELPTGKAQKRASRLPLRRNVMAGAAFSWLAMHVTATPHLVVKARSKSKRFLVARYEHGLSGCEELGLETSFGHQVLPGCTILEPRTGPNCWEPIQWYGNRRADVAVICVPFSGSYSPDVGTRIEAENTLLRIQKPPKSQLPGPLWHRFGAE